MVVISFKKYSNGKEEDYFSNRAISGMYSHKH